MFSRSRAQQAADREPGALEVTEPAARRLDGDLASEDSYMVRHCLSPARPPTRPVKTVGVALFRGPLRARFRGQLRPRLSSPTIWSTGRPRRSQAPSTLMLGGRRPATIAQMYDRGTPASRAMSAWRTRGWVKAASRSPASRERLGVGSCVTGFIPAAYKSQLSTFPCIWRVLCHCEAPCHTASRRSS
jgi:hypothetical protein